MIAILQGEFIVSGSEVVARKADDAQQIEAEEGYRFISSWVGNHSSAEPQRWEEIPIKNPTQSQRFLNQIIDGPLELVLQTAPNSWHCKQPLMVGIMNSPVWLVS